MDRVSESGTDIKAREEHHAIEEKLEEFVEAERAAKLVVNEPAVAREARAIQSAIIKVLDIRTAAGQIALAGCWRILKHQYFLHLGYETYEDWARTELGNYESSQYLRELALIATKVVAPIESAHKAGTPYLDNKGEAITSTRILETPGLLGKLKIAADAIHRAIANGKGEEAPLLAAVISGTRREVEKARNQVGRGEIPHILGMRQLNGDGSIDLFFPALTPRQMIALEASMGEMLELNYQSVAPYTNSLYNVAQEENEMTTFQQATVDIVVILDRQPDMVWSMEEVEQFSPETARRLWAQTNGFLQKMGFEDEQRIALCSWLFDREIQSTKELRRSELEALSRMLTVPAFRDCIVREYTT